MRERSARSRGTTRGARALALGWLIAGCASAPHERPPPAPSDPTSAHLAPLEATPSAPPYDLGALPEGVVARWPTPPRTTRAIETSDPELLVRALAEPGTRAVFHGQAGDVVIAADDTDLVLAEGASVGELRVERGTHRARITGGRARRVVLAEPAIHWPELTIDPTWFAEDVLVDGVTLEHADGGIELRGRRVAVVRCRTRVRDYSIWSGGAYGDALSEDLVIAGNHFVSAGPEATVRVHDASSVLVVGNVLVNGTAEMEMSKHNLRFHGRIGLAYAARNVLVHSGVMTALEQPPQLPPDRVERLWLVDNEFHQLRPSLLELSAARLPRLVLTGNVVYSSRHACLWCASPREGWVLERNEMRPYAPPAADVVPAAIP